MERFQLSLENILVFLFASEVKCCLSLEIYALCTNANRISTQILESRCEKGVTQLESVSGQIKFRGKGHFIAIN